MFHAGVSHGQDNGAQIGKAGGFFYGVFATLAIGGVLYGGYRLIKS